MIDMPLGQNLQDWQEVERFETWTQDFLDRSLLILNTLWNRIMPVTNVSRNGDLAAAAFKQEALPASLQPGAA